MSMKPLAIAGALDVDELSVHCRKVATYRPRLVTDGVVNNRFTLYRRLYRHLSHSAVTSFRLILSSKFGTLYGHRLAEDWR